MSFQKHKIGVLLILLVIFACSCENIMQEECSRVITADDHSLTSNNDSIYSVIGILTQLQTIADRYVLQGELRADLIDVTDNTSADLRELSDLDVDQESNAYCDVTDYYNIINNCNYFLQNADTLLTGQGGQSLKKEYGVVKTIRDWVYLQLGLNYNQAVFYQNVLLTVDDVNADYPTLSLVALVDTLIEDMNEVMDIVDPDYGTVYEIESAYLFINKKFLMGELYLWKAALNHTEDVSLYKIAARYFTDLIDDEGYMSSGGRIRYTSSSFSSTTSNWEDLLSGTSNNAEMISLIPFAESSVDGAISALPEMMYEEMYTPSEVILNLWESQTYAYPSTTTVPTYTSGDLRQKASVTTVVEDDFMEIDKHSYGHTIIYRSGLLYLRLAEAVNRSGYPELAFAILKYGLNEETLTDNDIVSISGQASMPAYLSIFRNSLYDENIGIHSRGCGSSEINARYIMPTGLESKKDTINSVEEFICDELALELAFEGNRFTDLMRFSYARNDAGFLATRVAQKHSNYDAYVTLLSNDETWYLPVNQ